MGCVLRKIPVNIKGLIVRGAVIFCGHKRQYIYKSARHLSSPCSTGYAKLPRSQK